MAERRRTALGPRKRGRLEVLHQIRPGPLGDSAREHSGFANWPLRDSDVVARTPVTIHYLGHHPGFADRLAQWSWHEWRRVYEQRGQTFQHAVRNYRERINVDQIPIALIALNEKGELIGTVSLKNEDLEVRPEITLWLGGLYVVPEWRNRGVASFLMERAVAEARRLGLSSLHLWTSSAERLYTKLGWKVSERMDYGKKRIVVMHIAL